MKKQLLLLTMVMSSMAVLADEGGTCGYNDNLTWTYVEATKTLTIFGQGSMDISNNETYIPWRSLKDVIEKVEIGNGVTSICTSAFSSCNSLSSVSLPNSILSIGSSAFYRCSSLSSISLPNSILSIGSGAFSRCSSLSSITFPDSLNSIGASAFLGTLWYDNQPEGLVFAGKVVYTYKGTMPDNTDIVLKEGTLGIAESAFQNQSGLRSISIPNSITTIPNAFYGCSNLTTVTIHCNTISSVFSGLNSIKEVIIGNEVKEIGDYAFSSCSGLTSLTIGKNVISIGYNAFKGCTSLSSIIFPDNLSSIRYEALSGTAWLDNQPDGIVYAGPIAYLYKGTMPYNTNLEIKKGTLGITDLAFYGQSGLKSISLPDGLVSIEPRAFDGCSNLSSITIPTSLMKIGNGAFNGSNNLKTVYISDITAWCGITFGVYYSYDQLVLSSNPLFYAHHLFLNNEEITDLVIPDGVTTINDGAFVNCSSFSSVTIPNSLETIGLDAFSGCEGLSSVFITDLTKWCNMKYGSALSTPLNYANHLYLNGKEISDLVIPSSITNISDYSFTHCKTIKSLTLPSNLTSIGNNAFSGCKLENIMAKNPYTIFDGAFSDRTYQHAMCYVPEGTWNDAVYEGSWYQFNNIRETAMDKKNISSQSVYMLMDTRTFGYAVYDRVSNGVKLMKAFYNVDEEDSNNCWQIIEQANNTYLYNLGAKKYAYYTTDGKISLTDTATPIVLTDGDNGILLGTNNSTQWGFVKNNAIASIETSIVKPTAVSNQEAIYYDLKGQRINNPHKGINIVVLDDGTVKKIVAK